MSVEEQADENDHSAAATTSGEQATDQQAAAVVHIHNVDQRSPIVALEDSRLPGGRLSLEQRGAASEGFSHTTSSVVWGTAPRMARWLIDHPEVVAGKRVIEVGSGIGLVGATAAALGAASVVLTDCDMAMPLLERNSVVLAEQGLTVHVSKLNWGCRDDEDAACALVSGESAERFDVVLACDVVLAGWDTKGLLQSCERLMKNSEALFLLGFEFREDWETIGTLQDSAFELGLSTTFKNIIESGVEATDSDDEDEFYLYSISR